MWWIWGMPYIGLMYFSLWYKHACSSPWTCFRVSWNKILRCRNKFGMTVFFLSVGVRTNRKKGWKPCHHQRGATRHENYFASCRGKACLAPTIRGCILQIPKSHKSRFRQWRQRCRNKFGMTVIFFLLLIKQHNSDCFFRSEYRAMWFPLIFAKMTCGDFYISLASNTMESNSILL